MRRRAWDKRDKRKIRSETKGHNAVSVNCDARIKETVTPGEKETRGKRKSERTTGGMGASMEEGGPAEVEGGERRIFGGFAVVNNAL